MSSRLALWALATTAVAVAMSTAPAIAQQVTPAAQGGDQQLTEIVVTATRRSDTVHNIPLSISAVTPQQVDNQGLKTGQDLSRIVPALRVGSSNAVNGQVDVAVRGVRASNGAATTGIYIDDVSITQRNTNNPLPGGSVLPQLFDLERVEVLYGPQGTLYGGSSEGGTVRFITPQPSFTQMTGRVRVEGSSTEGGDPSYDLGAALGGPIVQDKIAFRVSGDYRKDGGYIDHVSQFTGATIASNTNSSENTSIHAILAVKPVERATITLSYLYTKAQNDDSDSFWQNMPQFTGLSGGAPHTYGPYNMFGPYKTGSNTNIGANYYTSDSQLQPLKNPNSHEMKLPSLVIDYAFDTMNFKSITAYVETLNHADLNFSYGDIESKVVGDPYIAALPNYSSIFSQTAKNETLSQEFRFSSNTPDSRLSWVGGLYYSYARLSGTAVINANLGDAIYYSNFPSVVPRAVASTITGGATDANGQILNFPQSVNETQTAGFGEVTYAITDKLKATVGLRITRDELNVLAEQGGALFFPTTPNILVQSVNQHLVESPLTPKFGLQYIMDPNNNFYFNAAEGFRSGGANADLRTSPSCANALTQTYGGVANQPQTYNSDSLWSYEGGAKSRFWGGRATINASLFYIDWKNPQTQFTLAYGCAQPTAISANADIISKGANFEGNVKLFPGFVATANVGYTDAHYNGVVNTGPGTPTIFNNGDAVPYTPKWTLSVAGQYDFNVMGRTAFVRADYQYQSSIVLGSGAGTVNYSVDQYSLPATNYVSARAGLNVEAVQLSLFVNNLTDSKDLLSSNGFGPTASGRACANSACSSYTAPMIGTQLTTYRPRTVGVDVTYRY